MRLLALLLLLAAPARADTLTVFAAASLQTALDAIAPEWEAATGHDLRLSYGGSGAMARQIALGAPADLFISANAEWMDDLDARGLLAPGTRRDILGNTLVLISPAGTTGDVDLATLPDALGPGRLALGETASVPAGIYARQALTALGLWDALSDRTIQSDNVRAALILVARGEAPFGIVYATDAAADPAVTVRAAVPDDSHDPITYPAAAIASGDTTLATAFLDHLAGPEAAAIFTAQGFTLPPAP